MSNSRITVPGMAEAIERRRKELGLSVGDLVERSGVTRQGLAPLRRGERRDYQDRLTMPVCRVLRWSTDSIERLMRGEPAVPSLSSLAGAESRDLLARVADLEQQLAELRADLRAGFAVQLEVAEAAAAATTYRAAPSSAREG